MQLWTWVAFYCTTIKRQTTQPQHLVVSLTLIQHPIFSNWAVFHWSWIKWIKNMTLCKSLTLAPPPRPALIGPDNLLHNLNVTVQGQGRLVCRWKTPMLPVCVCVCFDLNSFILKRTDPYGALYTFRLERSHRPTAMGTLLTWYVMEPSVIYSHAPKLSLSGTK